MDFLVLFALAMAILFIWLFYCDIMFQLEDMSNNLEGVLEDFESFEDFQNS